MMVNTETITAISTIIDGSLYQQPIKILATIDGKLQQQPSAVSIFKLGERNGFFILVSKQLHGNTDFSRYWDYATYCCVNDW